MLPRCYRRGYGGIFRFRLVVVLAKQIHVFTFPDKPVRMGTLETRENPKGLCEVSNDPQAQQYMAFPGYKMGGVQLVVSLEWTWLE